MKRALSVTNIRRGFLLIEVLLSLLLMSVVASALVGSFIYGQETTRLAGERLRASMLAGEALEATRAIRDRSFADLTDGSHGLAVAPGRWVFSGTSDSTGVFTRRVLVTSVDVNRKTIAAIVSWSSGRKIETVTMLTRLTNWRR